MSVKVPPRSIQNCHCPPLPFIFVRRFQSMPGEFFDTAYHLQAAQHRVHRRILAAISSASEKFQHIGERPAAVAEAVFDLGLKFPECLGITLRNKH